MTTDDILRMAREAGRWATNQTSDTYEWNVLRDERFAALVAAAEREAISRSTEIASYTRPPFRKCEFCGCHTNARVRACCEKGRAADGPTKGLTP